MPDRTWTDPGRPSGAASAAADTTTGPDADRRRRLARLQTVAYWLDDRFRLPGTNIRVGLDGIAGLVPGVGDTATTAVAGWIILEAWRLGMPRRDLVAMAGTVGVDWAIGLVPLVGDVFDVGFKANRRNIRRILRHFGEEVMAAPPQRP
ncbi:DUF4112 domain-containing protein [Caenispirillum bisanense]|uniref:DUF4112 domain-containing protein n=1 Tax=Caenispirillum bisanense TaxID=414052 RepID=A0A286GL90_9PROT|nr:DUF4112 domain-containing protein [Caenispirillum bisanense]SOD95859.1 protein of unknown function [Caenispirillum bisanense]